MSGRVLEESYERYGPRWLTAGERRVFCVRLAAAFARYRLKHGQWSLSDPFVRGRVIGGVIAAWGRRFDSAWGRRMLARRGACARLRQIAEAGEQRRSYFQALALRSATVRRRHAWERKLDRTNPRLAAHARNVLDKTKCPPSSQRQEEAHRHTTGTRLMTVGSLSQLFAAR